METDPTRAATFELAKQTEIDRLKREKTARGCGFGCLAVVVVVVLIY